MNDKTNPSENDVRAELLKIASRSLIGKPAGTIAMADEVIGVKKMGFRWVWHVHGPMEAIKMKLQDWIYRWRCGDER